MRPCMILNWQEQEPVVLQRTQVSTGRCRPAGQDVLRQPRRGWQLRAHTDVCSVSNGVTQVLNVASSKPPNPSLT